jgi:hypothetical protein
MADLRFQIQTYQVYVCGGPLGAPHGWRALITLVSGAEDPGLGAIRFYAPDVPVPEDTSSDGVIRMHLPLTMFPSIVDLLRNETPLWMQYLDRVGHAWIASTEEEVGEGE